MRPAKTLLFASVLLIPVAALTSGQTHACRLQVIPDYVTPISYKAVLRLSPACPAGTVLRVRKSSTLNVKRNGAPYQPIRPAVGAWEVGNSYSQVKKPVPYNELLTTRFDSAVPLGTRWQWEYWSPSEWNPRTQSSGRWLAGEVLYGR